MTFLLPSILALALLESVFYFSPAIKLTVTSLFLVGAAVTIGWNVLRPLTRPRSSLEVARHVENHFGDLHESLSNAVELGRRTHPNESDALARSAVHVGMRQADTLDLQASVPAGPVVSAWRTAALAFVPCVVLAFLYSSELAGATDRLLHPSSPYTRPARTHLHVEPGDVERIAGDELTLLVEIDGLVPTTAQLDLRETSSGDWVAHRVAVKDARAVLPLGLRQSFDYRWSAYDATSSTFRATVHPRPVVSRTRVGYRYPPHTRLPPHTDEGGGEIAAPVGTDVTLQVTATRPLDRGWLDFEDGRLYGSPNEHTVSFDLVVEEDRRFTVGLSDPRGIENVDPVVHRLLAIQDEPPEVAILHPGADGELGESTRISLRFEAIDDYGVDRSELRFRLNDDERLHVVPVALDSAGAPQLSQDTVWELADLDLLPGDRLTYHLRVYDNDAVTGPNHGDSRTYILRFPSLYEIQQEAQRRHDDALARLQEARDETDDVQGRAQELRREHLKTEDPSWEAQAETETLLERQEEIQRRVEETMARIEDTQTRLGQSGMLSDDTLQKLMEVRKLMAAIDTPELQAAAAELRDAMQATNGEQIEEAMTRLIEQQEEFSKGLDRTIALLKEVQNDQIVDALTRQISRLAEQQQQIADRATHAEDIRPLAEPQEAVAREAEAFEESLDGALDRLDPSTAAPLSDLGDRFESSSITPRSEQATRDLRARRADRARNQTRLLSEDLASLSEQMARIREIRLNRQKADVSRELSGLLQDVLRISRKQERTAAEAAGGQPGLEEQQARDLAAASRTAGRLIEATHKTFLIPRSAAAGLGNALGEMERTVEHLQRGSGARAATSAQAAMGHLNTSALGIQSALQALQNASSGSGFQEMLQRLQEASAKQGDLNAQAQGALGTPSRPGGTSPGDLGRMAAEQQAIQQMLDELRKRLGTQEGRVLGDLGGISDEMEEVAEELARGRLTRRTIDRQRQILSRMLDAQRSARQRGFSREREAKSGGKFVYRGPRSLPRNLGETVSPLRARMRDALREGYPADYQALIRRYFGRLIDEAQQLQGQDP